MKSNSEVFSCILVDDEQDAIDTLTFTINNYCPELKILATANNVEDAYEKIILHKPQVVFLDIKLREKNAFDLLDLFKKIDFLVIFVTAHDKYAIRAIRYSAIDYLLKPIHHIEVVKAIERSLSKIHQKQHFHVLKENLKKEKEKKIVLNIGNELIITLIKDILYCEADGNFTWVYLEGKEKYYVSKSLLDFEEILSEQDFFRTHKSFLVNIQKVKGLPSKDSNIVILSNEITIPISFRKRKAFLDHLKANYN